MLTEFTTSFIAVGRDSQFLTETRRRLASEPSGTIRKKKNQEEYESSWNIAKNYMCTVQSVGGLNVDPGRLVEVSFLIVFFFMLRKKFLTLCAILFHSLTG